MMSAKSLDFLPPPPCLHLDLIHIMLENSRNLPYYVRFSMTPFPPPSDAAFTSGNSLSGGICILLQSTPSGQDYHLVDFDLKLLQVQPLHFPLVARQRPKNVLC